jgi:hypothetical protein
VAHLLLALVLTAAQAEQVPVRYPLGTLHGFPSMSDAAGKVIANGELTQEVAGDRVVVHIRWEFADGRRAEERDEFRAGRALGQERFSWVETRGGIEQRRFEVDFSTGKATSSVRDEKGHVDRDEKRLDLPRGRSFTGYGAALAVSQLALGPGEKAELTFVAFTAKPRTVTLEARREGEEPIGVAGRSIACDRYTLHPKIPFPLDLVAGAQDAHLWLSHAAPPSLVRAEQNLVTKDDPQVVIDVTPRGAAHPAGEARARRGQRSAPREPTSQGTR